MARGTRLQFAGAIYHVISRGNYQQPIFVLDGSGYAFEKALFEACERYEWILHGYVIMSNHYHLALETPAANLCEGMQWLQTTFATRFNGYQGQQGRVFQGRYKAPLVQPGHHLATLVDYIHLNPVRAGLCQLGLLRGYTLSSYSKLFRDDVSRPFLHRTAFLGYRGFSDDPDGMKRYEKWLEMRSSEDPEQAEAVWQSFIEGWAIGDDEFKKGLLDRMTASGKGPDDAAYGMRKPLRESEWGERLAILLAAEGKSVDDARKDRKGADWKRRVALRLRKESTATNAWIASAINCGHHSYISRWAAEERKELGER